MRQKREKVFGDVMAPMTRSASEQADVSYEDLPKRLNANRWGREKVDCQ
jgi:hypothetical protein